MAEQRTGHRGRWTKWLALYVIAGGLVYLAVYLIFLRGGGGY